MTQMLSFAYAKEDIHIAIGIDMAPFIFGKSSKKGIIPDIITEVFNNTPYIPIFIQKPKNYLIEALHEDNIIDAVASITIKDKNLFQSDPFISYKNYVITREKDHIKLNTIEELSTIKFVSWKESYYDLGEKFYTLYNPVNGTQKKSYNENYSQKEDIEMFFSKKVDAIIIDKTIFNWYKVHFNNNKKYVFHDIFKKSHDYPVVFRSKKVRDIFNKELKKLKKSGRYKQIIEFYKKTDMQKLINYANLIGDISSKFVFERKDKELKKILNILFVHRKIKSIQITTIDGKIFLNLSKKLNQNEKIYSSNFIRKKIYYKTGNDIEEVGTLKITYTQDLSLQNSILIPPLESYEKLSDYDRFIINKSYKNLNLKKSILLNKQEIDYINRKKYITVHNETNWAPYNFNDNGIPKGFVIDYFNILANRLNLDIKYISGHSWSQFLNMIKTEQIDVLSNVAKTKDRERYINFTNPYIVSKKAIFSNIPNIKNFSDLRGKTIAIPEKFYLQEYIEKNYPNIKIKTFKDIQECLYALVNNKADALIENYAVVNYLIKKNGLDIKYTYIQNDDELTSKIRIGVIKSQTILKDILQKAQNSVTKKEIEELKNKWFSLESVLKKKELSKREQEYLKKRASVNVCTNPNWRPIEFSEDGNPKGISIDILKIILKKLNLKPVFIQTNSWLESQEYLKFKKCDILASAIKTPSRATYANFSKPFASYDLAIITKNNRPSIYNFSTIATKSIARKKGSGIAEMVLKEYPNIKTILTQNMYQTFELIENEEAYFTVATLPVFLYNQKKYSFNHIQVSRYYPAKADLRVAVRNDDKILLNSINKAIDLISDDTIKAINEKWTSQKVIKKIDYTIAFIVLIISLSIILLIYYAYKKQQLLKEKIEILNRTLEKKVEDEIEKNREKEKLMLHQNRLAQMGETISLIAHQWRQPLNILSLLNQSTYIKYKRGTIDNKAMEEFQKKSKTLIKNMSKMIDDFRNFFKPTKKIEKFSINKLIDDTILLIKPNLDSGNIKLSFNGSNNIYIDGYKSELGHAVLNILNNAKDALIESSKIKKCIEISLNKIDNGEIQISIKDNADGIPDNIIEKIFEPYFSTKDKNGTGLGLYMTKIIIEKHMNGYIKIDSSENGSRFDIFLKEVH